MLLSVIIVSYNSKHVLKDCFKYLFERLEENFLKNEYEVIVVDNGSTDETANWLSKQKKIHFIKLSKNVGFAAGNNEGAQKARGKYLLFLNSDAYLNEKISFQELMQFLENDETRAGLTVRLTLPDGKLDPACHRGFPTALNSLFYFVGFERLFKHTPFSTVFGGYHMTAKNVETIHEIDALSGALFLLKRSVFEEVKGFDTDYFFYAEDIDLCYRIKQKKYSLWFYPLFSALHLKGQSGVKSADTVVKQASKKQFYETMLTFYNKHYARKNNKVVNTLVRTGVQLLLFLNRV